MTVQWLIDHRAYKVMKYDRYITARHTLILILTYRNSGSTSSALNDIAVPMTENEAYAPVHVSDTHHVKTLPNEAYGTLNY